MPARAPQASGLSPLGALRASLGATPRRLPPLRAPERRIRLSRFAGPAVYAERLERPLRVAHLTDQHVGFVTPMELQLAAVEATNAQRPDLVALSGDFVCHSQLYLADLQEVIRAFDAPVVAVLGNHDYWAGARSVRRALKRAGVAVLRNDHTTLDLGGQRLQVVGVDDAYTGHADVRRAVRGLRADLPTLGLSHIAEEADALWAAGVPLVLAGHTHAGQITVARLNELALGRVGGHRYVHGLYGHRDRSAPHGAVYVGAGIGAAVVPFRVGKRARPEVTVFELGRRTPCPNEHHGEQAPLGGRGPSARKKAKRRAKVIRLQERRSRRG